MSVVRGSSRSFLDRIGAAFTEAFYRLTLLAYPRSFRRRYGPGMLELMRLYERRAARRGPISRLRLMLFLGADSVRNGFDARLGRSPLESSPPPESSRRRPTAPSPSPRGSIEIMSRILHETRQALRRLARAPVFSVATLLVLAVGIGAGTTLFSVVSALMLRPQPFAEPQELVDIYQDSDGGDPNSTSFPAYRDIADHDRIFAGVAASMSWGASLLLPDGARPISPEFVTHDYFDVLGLELQMGRDFEPAADAPGAPPQAILGDRAWRTLYGADPEILGETIRINGAAVTVIGVGPRDYGGLMPGTARDVFLSLSSLGPVIGPFAAGTLERRQDHWFTVKGRLAPGVTPSQAQAAMDSLAARLAREFPELNQGRDITVFAPGEIRIHPQADAQLLPISAGLMTVAGLFLLLVCSNVANLFLVRATRRGPEVSLRLALGAPRGRILGHVMSESLILGLAGGLLGVLGARWGIRMLRSGVIPVPTAGTLDVRLDVQVLLFAVVVAVGASLLSGVLPAFRLSRSDAMASLRNGAPALSGSTGTRWSRNALVGLQVALSFVILVLAGLFARGLMNAADVDLGFATNEVAVLRTDASHAGYDATEARQLFDRLENRLEALPGVESVARAAQPPVGMSGSSTLTIDGYRPATGTDSVEVMRATVSPDYFEALDVPILHGRSFRSSDDAASPTVAIVSRAMARAYWGREDVVGERFRFQSSPDSPIPIVGVVDDVVVQQIGEEPTPLFYRSSTQMSGTGTHFLVRTDGPAAALLPTIRRQLQELDSTLPVLRLTTLAEHVADSLALPRTGTTALAGFGVLGLILAAIGLYAVVASAVQRRTRELGIRIALGADRGNVLGAVLGEMLVLTSVALATGLAIAYIVAPMVTGGLVGVDGLEPPTVALTGVLMLLAAALAAWVPARRAARLDPALALREE